MVDHGAVLAAARAMDQVAQALAPCGDALDQRARELAGTLAAIRGGGAVGDEDDEDDDAGVPEDF
jgi:hypothetical protein